MVGACKCSSVSGYIGVFFLLGEKTTGVENRKEGGNEKRRDIKTDSVAGDLANVGQGLKVEGTAHLGHGQGHLLQPLYKPSCCLHCLLTVPV